MAGGGPFKWLKPEVYPLVAVVVVASALGVYSSIRHLWTNPEVFPSRSYRQEGIPESEELEKRARGYETAIFRSLQEGRKTPEADRPDTRIFTR